MADNAALAVIGSAGAINEDEVTALAEQVRPLWSKDLNKEQALVFARVALSYGFDPFRGEIVPYQGKPFVTVDGYLRIADKHPAYDGFDHRPATEEERKALKASDDEMVWAASVYRKDRGRPVMMFGRAGGPNERNPLVSGKNQRNQVFIEPADQALVRALRRALRASLAIPLPGEDVDADRVTPAQLRHLHALDDERGVDRERRHTEIREVFGVEASNELTKGQASAYIDGRLVDTTTGEVEDPAEEVEAEVAEADATDQEDEAVLLPKAIDHLTRLSKDLKLEPWEIQGVLMDRYNVRRFQDLDLTQSRELYRAMDELVKEYRAKQQ